MAQENDNGPRSVTPPETVFDRPPRTLDEQVMESAPLHVFTGKVTVPPEGGMNLHFDGLLFPKKGFPFMQSSQANNIVKRQTMMFAHLFARKDMILPILGFAVLPYRMKLAIVSNFLENYCRNSDYIFEQFYLKDNFMTPCAQEIKRFLTSFLHKLGVSPDLSFRTARIMATMVEYDDAYRYRIEDLGSVTDADLLRMDPGRELARLISVSAKREKYITVTHKFSAFAGTLSKLMRWSPRIRRAFTESVDPSRFKWLQLDEADRYHVLYRDDYEFMGRTYEDRAAEFTAMHGAKPIRMIKYQPS